jgi:S-adenosylmethionine synthetase
MGVPREMAGDRDLVTVETAIARTTSTGPGLTWVKAGRSRAANNGRPLPGPASMQISPLPDPSLRLVEIVERKGLGHPDTICDALAEAVSVALSRHYLERFGVILHHNVDKVLLSGGSSTAAFGGGEVTQPIEITLAGRATQLVRDVSVPVEDLAVGAARAWLRANLSGLDVDRHVRMRCRIHPGSSDLVDLFERRGGAAEWRANDTSIGVGYAPLSPLERSVLAIERHLTDAATRRTHPAIGEDVKVMAVSESGRARLTVSCAMRGARIGGIGDYLARREEVAALARRAASDWPGPLELAVNAADDPARGAVFLTVTGTSAESGDDGETGRGNRSNGLITPCRPMTMEAVAGKNPVSHVGKLYNVAAFAIAQGIVAALPAAGHAECYLVSRIGAPVGEPQLVDVRLSTRDASPPSAHARAIEAIVAEHLGRLGTLWRSFLDGTVPVY